MKYLIAFERYLFDDGKSAKTIESYVGDVRNFIHRHYTSSFNGVMSRFSVLKYKQYLVETNYAPATINKKINSLSVFNSFLISEKLMTDLVVFSSKDRIKIAQGSERSVEVYSEKTLSQLEQYIQADTHKREAVILMLLLFTGVRVSELCHIKLNDIDALTQQIKILGKGGKYREIPLREDVLITIQNYIGERSNHTYAYMPYLLLGQRGNLRRDAINRILLRIEHTLQLDEHLKPHKFRHTFCTRLISKGVPITTVSKLAGHAKIDTTSKFYIRCNKNEKEHAVCLL